MPIRGPKPIPNVIKLATGNRGRRPVPLDEEPEFSPADTSVPEYLSPVAREEWGKLVHELARTGVLKTTDRFILSAFCQSMGVLIETETEINRQRELDGPAYLTVTTANGAVMQNPLIGIANVARRDAARYAAELGLTPSSRARLKVNNPTNKESAAQKYLG